MLTRFLRRLTPATAAEPAQPRRSPSMIEPVPEIPGAIYHEDGLHSIHNHDFTRQPAFLRAYERGVQAVGHDYNWRWRVHVGLWAASIAERLPGDFVECGVNRGFLASAIMTHLDWDRQGRTFWLLDTFAGLDARYILDEERESGIVAKNQELIDKGLYTTSAEAVRRNFAEWRNVTIIEGPIPDTLPRLTPERVAFASIDMNCAPPEIAAMEHLWDRLVPGAPVLLDDYAYHGYRPQKVAMDAFARGRGAEILSLPTGQGLLIRPPA